MQCLTSARGGEMNGRPLTERPRRSSNDLRDEVELDEEKRIKHGDLVN